MHEPDVFTDFFLTENVFFGPSSAFTSGGELATVLVAFYIIILEYASGTYNLCCKCQSAMTVL